MLHVQQTVALITPERIKRSLCRQQDFPRRSGEKLKLKLLFFPANIITNEQKYFPYKLQLNLLSFGRGVWENPRGNMGAMSWAFTILTVAAGAGVPCRGHPCCLIVKCESRNNIAFLLHLWKRLFWCWSFLLIRISNGKWIHVSA